MPVQASRRLFTVNEYYRMADAGIFGEDDRVELLSGAIVEMTPIGSRHAAAVSRLNHIFTTRLSGAAILRVQDPVRLDDYSEPQPDLAIVRPRHDFYRDAHPSAADVLLLIEVADTSADVDRIDKIPVYARAGVAEVWVVDLNAGHIDVYRGPAGDRYLQHEIVAPGNSLRPSALPQIDVSVDAVF
jgi:Uma2 family endonuclease